MNDQSILSLTFDKGDPSLRPTSLPVSDRSAYYLLTNIDEHPEVLPMAHDIAMENLAAVKDAANISVGLTEFRDSPNSLPQLIECLTRHREEQEHPGRNADEAVARRQSVHFFTQFAPTALVDGCWLQGVLRVATAHTPIGACMSRLYEHQVHALAEDPHQHVVSEYRDLHRQLVGPLNDVSTHAFVDNAAINEAAFSLPLFLLSIGQFPRSFQPEILGVHLGWQFLGLAAIGPDLIRDVRSLHGLPDVETSLPDAERMDKGRQLTLDAVEQMLDETSEDSAETWPRIWTGVAAIAHLWTQWVNHASDAAPTGPPDPRQAMIELLCRKAPHAYGYHGNKRIGEERIDDLFAPDTFNPSRLLNNLATSRFVQPGKPEKSNLVKSLVEFGGPMLAVFSDTELETMRNWIQSLPIDGKLAPVADATKAVAPAKEVSRPRWSKKDFRRRSETRFGNCSVRELYHYLVNIEYYPDILPVAERFARNRLERSMARLNGGERPIPSATYSAEALENWVYTKHRAQVDSYRPLDGEPRVSKDAFTEGTVQLAPLILIDGGWLQNMPNPNIIHTVIGRMLFRIFYEELGGGDPTAHHANIYRDLLAAMGEEAPPVETMEFANWSRLRDASFEVPALWLSISCFPRHFMPEILGLNLAVELAGIGGPYMEARDTLRYFGLPTLFVEIHNAADNVTNGHAGQSLDAIKRYMDEVAAREGPHNLDVVWRRVWSGVRSTLPQIGALRFMAHRVRNRVTGVAEDRTPMIFRS